MSAQVAPPHSLSPSVSNPAHHCLFSVASTQLRIVWLCAFTQTHTRRFLLTAIFEARLVLNMGNKPAKQEKDEILLKVVPPLDHAYVRWLARDLERIHGFTPRNPCAVKPPEHYIEYMRMNGWLDLNLDDPDLAHLFK